VMGTGENTATLAMEAEAAGFITAPDDVRLRVAACAGLPACPQGLVDARAVATRLAPLWAGSGVLHVSGCAKGCAAPGGAAVTLVAEGKTYNVVLNGRARDVPAVAGLSLDETVQWMRERRLCR
jgi:precorrin-3B synthase